MPPLAASPYIGGRYTPIAIVPNGYGPVGPLPPTPGSGITLPGTGITVGGSVPIPGGTVGIGTGAPCPAGTACSGPTVAVEGLGSICLGACRELGGAGGIVPTEPGQPATPTGQLPVPVSCDTATLGYCRAVCPSAYGAGNGVPSVACQLANGRKGRLNKTGYWLKSGQYVPPGSKCVTPRRKNFANGPAASRAADRVAGTYRMLEKFDKIISKKFKRAGGRRTTRSRSKAASCSCRS